MMALTGVESLAMPRAIASPPQSSLHRQMALKTPSEAPRPVSQGPQDRVELSSDAVPLNLTMRATAVTSSASAAAGDLTAEQQAFLQDLKARDREVRAHEQAHASVGGIYAGAPQYDYVTGPDGMRYAVGGEVKIDVSPIPDDPEATIDKMLVVRDAALAPREPSAQDRRVAETADRTRMVAEADLREMRADAKSAVGSETADPSTHGSQNSFAARLFADVAASYRQATAFFAISDDAGELAVSA